MKPDPCATQNDEIRVTATHAKKQSKLLREYGFSTDTTNSKYWEAIKTVQTWRSQCAPATRQCFELILECCTDIDGVIVTYRMKRIPSIVKKICRKNTNFELHTLDDIGGCRIITNTIEDLHKIRKRLEIKLNQDPSEILKIKDYIATPNSKTGYRSCHILTKQTTSIGTYRVEVQLRTRLEHYWATSVELLDQLLEMDVKSMGLDSPETSISSIDILDFHRLASSLIAFHEDCPIIPESPTTINELKNTISNSRNSKRITRLFNSAKDAVNKIPISFSNESNPQIFILEFFPNLQLMLIHEYNKDQLSKALEVYSKLEKGNELEDKDSEENVVLVYAKNRSVLPDAYPNYSANSEKYLKFLHNHIPALFENE